MGKKNRGTRRNSQRATTSVTGVKVIGVLADDSVIRTAVVEDQPVETAVRIIANDLQTHIDSAFSLREHGIKIDIDTVLLPGQQVTHCHPT